MRLYLVRHGEAGLTSRDSERRLTAAGRAAVLRLAERMAAAGIHVDQIRHSGLARARETAEILALHLSPPLGVAEAAGIGPDDDPEAAAIELSVAEAPLLLVSHMPFVAELTGRLVAGRPGFVAPAFGTAELRVVERDGERWRPVPSP